MRWMILASLLAVGCDDAPGGGRDLAVDMTASADLAVDMTASTDLAVTSHDLGDSSDGGDDAPTPPPCANVAAGSICVHGLVRDFVTNAVFEQPIHVALYDPLSLLTGGPPIAETDVQAGGYLFQNVAPPANGLIAVVAGDTDLATANEGKVYVSAATGAQNVQPGGTFLVDVYALERTVVDGWGKTSGAGSAATDWYTSGGYISMFYEDPRPDPTLQSATETHPVSDVTLTTDAQQTSGAVYFSTDRATIDTSLQKTSRVGTAIAPPPPGVHVFSGSGGTDSTGAAITWEKQTGGAPAHVIFIARFHPY
jgi:hypothetical protein